MLRARTSTVLFPFARLLDAVQVIDGPQQQRAPGRRWRRPAHFLNGVGAQQLELRPGLDDMSRPVVVQTEHFAVVSPGRRREAARPLKPAAVDLLAGLGVEAGQEAAAGLRDVDVAFVNQRRGDVGRGAWPY